MKYNLVLNSTEREYIVINCRMSIIDNNWKSLLRKPNSLKVVKLQNVKNDIKD